MHHEKPTSACTNCTDICTTKNQLVLVPIVPTYAPRKRLVEDVKDKFSNICSPLSQKLEIILGVPSVDMLGMIQIVMMKFMEVLGVDV